MTAPMNDQETAFVADLLRLYRERGALEAWRLLDAMSAAASDGDADRPELLRMAADAASRLPVRH